MEDLRSTGKGKIDFMTDESILKSTIENFIPKDKPKRKFIKKWFYIIVGGIKTLGLEWVIVGSISIYVALCGIYINIVWIIELFKN